MTQTMLERAARAAAYRWFLGDFEPEAAAAAAANDWTDFEDIARAVLMAVREPSEAMSQAVRTTEGWEDMIDFVLNEPQR